MHTCTHAHTDRTGRNDNENKKRRKRNEKSVTTAAGGGVAEKRRSEEEIHLHSSPAAAAANHREWERNGRAAFVTAAENAPIITVSVAAARNPLHLQVPRWFLGNDHFLRRFE